MNYSDDQIHAMINSVPYWYHQIEVRPGLVTPGVHTSSIFLEQLDLPADCSGMRVLDLGARDGFYSFELERRGATVTAIDYIPSHITGFNVAHKLLNSNVTFIQDNIYNVSPKKYGQFDIVLFLGLIYHLPDPMGALDIVRSVCTHQMYLETHAIDNGVLLPDGRIVPLASISPTLLEIPIMQFYPGSSLNNDDTNYWGPNSKCMEKMLIESDFVILAKKLYGGRAIFKCEVGHNEKLEYLRNISRGNQLPAL